MPDNDQAVTQADIDAAIDLKYALDDLGSTSWSFRVAEPHEHPVAKAFARHRIAASTAERDVEGLHEAFGRWLKRPDKFDTDTDPQVPFKAGWDACVAALAALPEHKGAE